MKVVFVVLVVVGLAAGGAAYYTTRVAADPPAGFRTVSVERGDLCATISATGTVEPEELVNVGAQVAGKINSFGPDPRGQEDPRRKNEYDPRFKDKTIDYTSPVHEGTVLAVIDDSLYRAQRDQAAASLKRAEADLGQARAKCEQARQEWDRAQKLQAIESRPDDPAKSALGRPIKAISQSDFDLAKANYEVAKANVEVGRATIDQARAALQTAETNLAYTVIKSPVEGVIITRRVNVGQTVVASLNAPSLFLIAKDLSKMEVWASVNEAYIGRIHRDMPVRFTVDTYPGEEFRGRVSQIRLNAATTQNVVTYTVVVATDNSDGRLLPYLTANLDFEVEYRNDVLKVPNAALRWKPRPLQIAPDVRDAVLAESSAQGDGRGSQRPAGPAASVKPAPAASGTKPPPAAATPSPTAGRPATPAKGREDRGRLWVADGGHVRPIDVRVGITDGTVTEVSSAELKEGMEVVIGEGRKDDGGDAGDTTNPFAPKLFRGKSASKS
jgi:HlyD family secretion protein